ncbi:MAG TPA: FAD binding domain-containing protein [Paraburkholderia sp.]
MSSLPNARAIAGGQSLMPMLNMRLVMPDHVIDLNGITSLQGIRESGGVISIGAMTRQRDLEFSAFLKERVPLAIEAILLVGHRQTRNRGTIGGSLCHLDPSAELPTICMALDATLIATGHDGRQRAMPMREFATDLMTVSLEPDELLTEIRIDPWPRGHGYAFVEFGRRHGDFAIASAAVMIDLDSAARVKRASLTLGGVGPVPVRMSEAEALLVGETCEPERLDAAAAQVRQLDALDDPAYPSSYRKRIAMHLLRRALDIAVARATPSKVTR